MTNSALFLALLLLSQTPAAAQERRPVFRFGEEVTAWIPFASRSDLARIESVGGSVEGLRAHRARVHMPGPDVAERLVALGFSLDVVPDPVRANPNLLAGYHTVASLTGELQALAAAYPGICRLHDIGTSVQGRSLLFVQISDNVAFEEDEPEVKLIASMHGDEPVGMELSTRLIRLLLEGYGSEPAVTALVDETEIWIMPLMNPDGFSYTSRYNAQGVDLNRDFPDRVTDPHNNAAGRAPETAAVMAWAAGHSTVLSANLHSGALVVNYPYDSDPNPFASYSATPEDALFVAQSLTYSTRNQPMFASPFFPMGITNGVQWYTAHGGMQDWNYVWMACNEVTLELSDVKFPSYGAIDGLWDDNRVALLAYLGQSLEGVRGVVSDAMSGQPLDARIDVTGVAHATRTDPDVGDYHRMLLPGTYDLRFSAPGYRPQVRSGVVVAASGPATRLDVALSPLVRHLTPSDVAVSAGGTRR